MGRREGKDGKRVESIIRTICLLSGCMGAGDGGGKSTSLSLGGVKSERHAFD